MHPCASCFVHSCWEPIGVGVTQNVCFVHAARPGHHLPWRQSYSDLVEGAVPLIYQWSAS